MRAIAGEAALSITRAAMRAHAAGSAPVVAEGMLIEIGLQMRGQMRGPIRATVRSKVPAFQERDGPVASLHGVGHAQLGLGLHLPLTQ